MADRETAAGPMGLVQAFVNSTDLQDGPEELSTPEALTTWLSGHGLMPAGAASDQGDLRHAVALREALRGIIGANSGGAGEAHCCELGKDAKCSLLRAAAAQVQTDRPVHARDLLLGEAFLAEGFEAVGVRLAAADRADVADILLQHRAQRRQVELWIVSQDHHVRRSVKGE